MEEHESHSEKHEGTHPVHTEHTHHAAPKSDTITIKKDNLWKYSTFILVALVIVMAFTSFGDRGGPTGATVNTGDAPAAPAPSAPAAPTTAANANADDDAALGTGEVTLIEFTDFQCPFCSRHHEQTFPQLKTNFIDTNLITYVTRDFPLDSIHPNARPAAEAAECLRSEGGDEAYYDYVDKIFANQQALSQDNLIAWGTEAGYDIESCLTSGEFKDEVSKDLADGQAAGCRGTPCFVLVDKEGKGTLISGAQPYSAFESAINAALA